MEDSGASANLETRREDILVEYELAQETAFHSDSIIHEVAAIVWGANTLLLGFILEVPTNAEHELLVIPVAIIGILLSVYVPYVNWLAKKGQHVAYAVCREIECELKLPHQLHHRIDKKYPKKRGTAAIYVLTGFFIVGWLWVICHASFGWPK